MKAYTAELSNKHGQQEATEENTNPQVFVPASGVRHRLLKAKTGIEEKFLNNKKPKKGRANAYKTMHVGLGRQLKEAKAILAKEDVPIDCSLPCSQELPEGNFPVVVLLAVFSVRKFQGCKGEILRIKCPAQKIWAFFCIQAL